MPPSNQAGAQNPNYRQTPVGDRQPQPPPPVFEGQADGQGRNSPQPTSDRGENDPEKALKDLGTFPHTHVRLLYSS